MKYFVLVLICINIETATSLFCYWNTGCPYKYFSSGTPYNSVRGDIRDSIIKIKGCEPISIWGLYRHGKRSPDMISANNMKEAIPIRNLVDSSYVNGNSSLCAQDVDNLRDWHYDSKTFDEAKRLDDEGYQEMLGLGKRLKQAFSELLSNLEEPAYLFRPAIGSAVEESAKGFTKGLSNEYLTIGKSKIDYDIMAPYATCGKYQKHRLNPDTDIEATKYLKTTDYLVAKDRIQRRSGIDYTLTDTNITALYDLCRYTSSGLDSILSPWCSLFTIEDLKVLEYIGDLRRYYESGYGTPFIEKFGHVPMADLYKSFQQAKNGEGKKITAYFSHAAMMNMVFTALGLFKDEVPLTAANRDIKRKWRSSDINIFSANFVAVLNRCSSNESKEYSVVFYLNEEPLRSICKEGVCSWQEIEAKFNSFVNTSIDFCELE